MSDSKTDDTIRLGGMALPNGVLVHGPRAWACAIRTDDGELKVVGREKRFRAADVRNPLLRGLLTPFKPLFESDHRWHARSSSTSTAR